VIPAALAILLAAADPCGPPPGELRDDAGATDAYRAVARAEEAAGDDDTAAAAWREVLRRAPDDAAARAAHAAACARREGARRFEEGLARFDARDWAGAAAAFAESRRAPAGTSGASAALLEGIARFELGDDSAADAALSAAAREPASRETARLYQGLLALRAGAPARAATAFEDAAGSRALAPLANQLARQARASGKLLLIVSAEGGRDSNPALAPEDASDADTTGGASLLALVRPAGRYGPYLRASAFARRYAQEDWLDLAGANGAAGIQLGRDAAGGLLEYDLAWRTLAGSPYLVAHRALASGWFATGRILWSATAAARLERYATDWDPLSGLLYRGELRAGVPLGGRGAAGLSYAAARDDTETAALSWLEHGPRADLQLLLGRRVVLLADAGLALRRADAFDVALGDLREDVVLDGTLALEWDLRHGLFLRGSLYGRRAWSSVPALEHRAWTPSLGLRWVWAGEASGRRGAARRGAGWPRRRAGHHLLPAPRGHRGARSGPRVPARRRRARGGRAARRQPARHGPPARAHGRERARGRAGGRPRPRGRGGRHRACG